MSTITESNVSRPNFIADPNSIVQNTGRNVNWGAVVDTDDDEQKYITAGSVVSLKNGGLLPRKDAEIALASASESGGTATSTSSAAHGLAVGDTVVVTGFAVTDYNGTYKVATVPSTTTFTVTGVTGSPADDNAGGVATSPAVGLLLNTINQAERNRSLSGQGVIIGGVVYEALLPDNGDDDWEDFKTELESAGNGFTYETYQDDRAS